MRRFIAEYKHFSVAVLTIIVGLAAQVSGNQEIARWLLTTVAAISAVPLLRHIITTLRTGHFGVDVLALTAITTAALLGEYWASIIIVLMLTGGEALEDYAEKRAKNELTSLLAQKPKKATLIKGRKVSSILVSNIQPGDKLRIKPGEMFPVDCLVIEGSTTTNESNITGESLPVHKSVGDVTVSGVINLDGAVTVRATHTAADSQYEHIIALVRAATSSQSPFVRLADRYSVPFTAIAFFIAGATWFISSDVHRFLEVLVVATPCPLILGAPIAIISGMSRGAKQGIIIKNGSALERLADVATFAFDKTGTLTQNNVTVARVSVHNGHTADNVLGYAAALEQNSTHVLGQAITTEAAKQQISAKAAKHVTELPGLGLRGTVSGNTVLIGRQKLLEDNGISIPSPLKNKTQKSASYIAIDGKLAGVITFTDTLRPEALSIFARLKAQGIRSFALITGDSEAAAITIAKKLDITDVYPECLPADKILAIEGLHSPVAFVGDGVNDAPVLTTASVGIALGARGSAAASDSADVVIMHDDLTRVADAHQIARRTMRIAQQSVMIGIVISIGLMAIFATGRYTAVQGAVIQEIIDIIVIIYALQAHRGGKVLRTTSNLK